jgi:hypothetical protein
LIEEIALACTGENSKAPAKRIEIVLEKSIGLVKNNIQA